LVVYRLAMLVLRPLVWIAFRPRVQGLANVPQTGGIIVCPNHLSGFDILAVGYALSPRPLRNMAKNQLFKRQLLGPLVRSLGGFPAHDGDELPGGVTAAAALAGAGEAVVIFPEGARRRPGRKHRPHTGAARTALVAGVPLVPAALSGTDGWRRRQRWRIAFGQPIPLNDPGNGAEMKAAREATRRLWQSITELAASLG
jgi:1-acyl-sn-glycerol-3-phosphate acyltransferase